MLKILAFPFSLFLWEFKLLFVWQKHLAIRKGSNNYWFWKFLGLKWTYFITFSFLAFSISLTHFFRWKPVILKSSIGLNLNCPSFFNITSRDMVFWFTFIRVNILLDLISLGIFSLIDLQILFKLELWAKADLGTKFDPKIRFPVLLLFDSLMPE